MGIYGIIGTEPYIKVGIVNQDDVCLPKDFLDAEPCKFKNLSYRFLNLMMSGDQFDNVCTILN
jgi:hypothetical protein